MKTMQHLRVAIITAVALAAFCGVAVAEDRADLSMAVAWHDASNHTYGEFPEGLYDGNTSSHGLVNYADEEVQVTFLFAGPVGAVGARAWWANAWGDPAYEWDFECAASVADLNAQSGSYQLLAQDVPTPADTWSSITFDEVSCSVYRWRGYRITGDHYLHLNELELILAEPDSAMTRKFDDPAGVAFDGSGRTVVADAGGDELVIVDDEGQLHGRVGTGELSAPRDVELDDAGRYVVADTGNDRVVRLEADGTLESVLAPAGTAAGEVLDPSGVSIDDSGRILVADTGNHRVQRLLADGTPDTAFGSGGAVGGPDPTWHDDGFDAPHGVHWDEAVREVFVADTLNERVQVLTDSGVYVRTVDAVYHPHDMVTLEDGTLAAVGDGTDYAHHRGSVRFVDPGGEFVDRQHFGGAVDVGRLTAGIARAPDGELVVADRTRGVLHRLRNGAAPALGPVSHDSGHDWIEVRYTTREPTVTRVYYGDSGLTDEAEDTTPKTDHRLRIDGLSPDTVYQVSVAYPRSQDGQMIFGPVQKLRTDPAPGQDRALRLRTVGMIYTWGRTAEEIADAHERLRITEEFYHRHSRGRLHLDVEALEVPRKYGAGDVESWGGFKASSAESDLAAAGYGPDDDIDEVIVFFGGVPDVPGGNYGGSNTIFGRHVGYCSYVTQTPFVILHEVNHTIDSIFAHLGYEPYEFNHGLWAIGSATGNDLVVNGEITQHVPDGRFPILAEPYGRAPAFADADGDGLLEDPDLPVTEASLGSDPSLPDTDFDGLTDLQEVLTGTTAGSNPVEVDTDGDGATQGADAVDRNPLVAIEGYVTKGSPTIDGVIDPGEGWTLVSSGVNRSNPFTNGTLDEPDHHPEAQVWAAWDDDAIYLAAQYAPSNVKFLLDANGDGWFAGYDNVQLEFNTTTLWRSAGMAADRDLMFAIDDDGGWSAIFDDSDKWLDPPPDGLGLDPLLVPGSVGFATGTAGAGETVAELRVPAGRRRQLEPRAGQLARLYTSLDGDVLWDHDRFAQLLLVDGIDTDGDGLWDAQESDLGSSPDSDDGDEDGLTDGEELAEGLDPLASDTDGDGALDQEDCAPRDGGSAFVPEEVTGLHVDPDGTVSWSEDAGSGSSTVYDLVREDAAGGASGSECLSGGGLSAPEYLDEEVPSAGAGWRYLARARNRCGAGSWGWRSDGTTERTRTACP